MNILFLTIVDIDNIDEHGIYTDLMRRFAVDNEVFIASPSERRQKQKTKVISKGKCSILKIKIGNTQKTNIIEKGISTLLVESQFKAAIKKFLSKTKFDLIIYSTPPITFAKVIDYVKKRDNAKSYLLLKDIFPQNAVDLTMFSKKSLIYNMFRKKEISLYQLSDQIGCMSEANVEFILNNNKYIDKSIVHVLPNCIEPTDIEIDFKKKEKLRNKFNIPTNKLVFIYGGNLGKPQGIPFIIECLKDNENKDDRFFVICGTGTEYQKLQNYISERKPNNVLLINGLPKDEYDEFILSCDVGLIFLDNRFTIPNFPSRMLVYMDNSMPVIASTDVNTDIRQAIETGKFGWWCESKNPKDFTRQVDNACAENLKSKSENSRKYLIENYTVNNAYEIMMNKFKS